MRTIVELPQDQVEALDALCRREGISRAEDLPDAIIWATARHESALLVTRNTKPANDPGIRVPY